MRNNRVYCMLSKSAIQMPHEMFSQHPLSVESYDILHTDELAQLP